MVAAAAAAADVAGVADGACMIVLHQSFGLPIGLLVFFCQMRNLGSTLAPAIMYGLCWFLPLAGGLALFSAHGQFCYSADVRTFLANTGS